MAAKKAPKVLFKPKPVKETKMERHNLHAEKIAQMKPTSNKKQMDAKTPKPLKVPKIKAVKPKKKAK